MRKKERPYVNDVAIELVSKLFTKEQDNHPSAFVTKKQVDARITKAFVSDPNLQKKPQFSYRVMERAIKRLCNKKIVKKDGRGAYWLSKNYDVSLERKQRENKELTRIIKDLEQEKRKISKDKSYFEGGYNAGKHFLEALIYCNSKEDWALLQAWFTKMRENKWDLEELETWHHDEEYNAQLEEGIKNGKYKYTSSLDVKQNR